MVPFYDGFYRRQPYGFDCSYNQQNLKCHKFFSFPQPLPVLFSRNLKVYADDDGDTDTVRAKSDFCDRVYYFISNIFFRNIFIKNKVIFEYE